jgi:hypothetical protein
MLLGEVQCIRNTPKPAMVRNPHFRTNPKHIFTVHLTQTFFYLHKHAVLFLVKTDTIVVSIACHH